MNIISATAFRNNFATTIKSVNKKREYLLVAKKGKLTSALIDIDLLEDLLEMTDKQFLKSIKKARNEYETNQTYTHEQVFGIE